MAKEHTVKVAKHLSWLVMTVLLCTVHSARSAQGPSEFSPVRDATPNTEVVSSALVLSSLEGVTSARVEGGEYSINGGAFTAAPVQVVKGDAIRVKVRSSPEEKGLSRAVVHLGDQVLEFNVITEGGPFGINLNEQIGVLSDAVLDVNFPEIQPEWVRGFLDFYSLFDKDTLEPLPEFDSSPDIARFIDIKNRGYKTVLSIKWNYRAKHTPTTMPSTAADLRKHQDALIALYEKVWPYVDILVVGNEPFIESPGDKVPSRDPNIVSFYRSMLDATISYRENSAQKDVPIFLGAFNRLELPHFQEASEGLLTLAKSTPEVHGIDLHIHHADGDFSAMKKSIEFATARMRPDQRFISTEFSPMHYWKSKSPVELSPAFTRKYDLPKGMKVYEYLDKVLATEPNPGAVTREEWVDFVEMNHWYKELQIRYLADAYETFTQSPQFMLATYAFRQGFHGTFDTTRDPWFLNAIFVNRTAQLRPDGSYELNRYYHHDFDRLR